MRFWPKNQEICSIPMIGGKRLCISISVQFCVLGEGRDRLFKFKNSTDHALQGFLCSNHRYKENQGYVVQFQLATTVVCIFVDSKFTEKFDYVTYQFGLK